MDGKENQNPDVSENNNTSTTSGTEVTTTTSTTFQNRDQQAPPKSLSPQEYIQQKRIEKENTTTTTPTPTEKGSWFFDLNHDSDERPPHISSITSSSRLQNSNLDPSTTNTTRTSHIETTKESNTIYTVPQTINPTSSFSGSSYSLNHGNQETEFPTENSYSHDTAPTHSGAGNSYQEPTKNRNSTSGITDDDDRHSADLQNKLTASYETKKQTPFQLLEQTRNKLKSSISTDEDNRFSSLQQVSVFLSNLQPLYST